jgi:hypothetical protein
VDLLRAFVSKVRRSPARYGGVDSDPEVVYERMPSVHFAIDGAFVCLHRLLCCGVIDWLLLLQFIRRLMHG